VSILDDEENGEEGECTDITHKSPIAKKRRKSTTKSELGTSFTEILGNLMLIII